MQIFEKILTKGEINSRFVRAVHAILANKLISSKAGLAESLGVKPAKFSEILNGRMNVGVDMIAILCDFYNVSPEWLLMSRGDNLFRNTVRPKIWVDDDDLIVKVYDDSLTSYHAEVVYINDPKDAEILAANKDVISTQKELIASLKSRISELEGKKSLIGTSQSAHSAASHGSTDPEIIK